MKFPLYQIDVFTSKVFKGNSTLVKQLSQRGGEAVCHLNGDRVEISGSVVKYLEGIINI